jgi:hypothetical protein
LLQPVGQQLVHHPIEARPHNGDELADVEDKRLSLARCRNLIQGSGNLSDAQLLMLRDQIYSLAEIICAVVAKRAVNREITDNNPTTVGRLSDVGVPVLQ